MQEQAAEALQTGKAVNGVKGPSMLSLLPRFDLAAGFPVDYMHGVLLGVTRMLLFAWFDSKHHAQQCYLGQKVGLVDRDLLKIRPPDFITRTPRSIHQRMYWKASE